MLHHQDQQFTLRIAAHIWSNALTPRGSHCWEVSPMKFHLELNSAHSFLKGRVSSTRLQIHQTPMFLPLVRTSQYIFFKIWSYITSVIPMNSRAGYNPQKSMQDPVLVIHQYSIEVFHCSTRSHSQFSSKRKSAPDP